MDRIQKEGAPCRSGESALPQPCTFREGRSNLDAVQTPRVLALVWQTSVSVNVHQIRELERSRRTVHRSEADLFSPPALIRASLAIAFDGLDL